MTVVIEARDVEFSFGQTPALRGASVAVEAGEILAIMGPSGSGKSTLLHCLAGILVPDSGEILFDGAAGRRHGRDRSAAACAGTASGSCSSSASSSPSSPRRRTSRCRCCSAAYAEARRCARAHAWFARLGLDGLEQRRSGELSGGQAQRVALARGLVAEPQVLFADEPTGALDSLTGEQVMDLLVGAAREQGTTVILVTHEPRVAAYADREVIVRDGRVNAPDRIAS